MHTSHDLEIAPSRQVLLAQAKANEKDLDEGSPDHPGESIDVADAPPADPSTAFDRRSRASNEASNGIDPTNVSHKVVPASLREDQPMSNQNARVITTQSTMVTAPSPPTNGTVVLDVEQGGIAVPSFLGKSVRSAIEIAEANGLDLEIVGSGIAQEQSPAAGAHVPSGGKITVRFGR